MTPMQSFRPASFEALSTPASPSPTSSSAAAGVQAIKGSTEPGVAARANHIDLLAAAHATLQSAVDQVGTLSMRELLAIDGRGG